MKKITTRFYSETDIDIVFTKRYTKLVNRAIRKLIKEYCTQYHHATQVIQRELFKAARTYPENFLTVFTEYSRKERHQVTIHFLFHDLKYINQIEALSKHIAPDIMERLEAINSKHRNSWSFRTHQEMRSPAIEWER